MIEYLQIYSLGPRFPRRETDKVDMLALGSRCWRWVRGIGGGRELPTEFVSPCSTYWHSVWVWTSWHWVQGGGFQDVEVRFETFHWFQDVGTELYMSLLVGFQMSPLVGFETLALGSRHRGWVLNVGGGFKRSWLGFEMLALWPRRHGWFEDVDTGIETSQLVDAGHSLVNGSGKEKEMWRGHTLWASHWVPPCNFCPRPLPLHPIWHLTITKHDLGAHIPLKRGGALSGSRTSDDMVESRLCAKKKKWTENKGNCRLLTSGKIQAWILKDPGLQVNQIRRLDYLQVTFMDPHPCSTLSGSGCLYLRACHPITMVGMWAGSAEHVHCEKCTIVKGWRYDQQA